MKVIYNDGKVGECPKEEELHVAQKKKSCMLYATPRLMYLPRQ